MMMGSSSRLTWEPKSSKLRKIALSRRRLTFNPRPQTYHLRECVNLCLIVMADVVDDDAADKLNDIYGPEVSAALDDDLHHLDVHTAAAVGN